MINVTYYNYNMKAFKASIFALLCTAPSMIEGSNAPRPIYPGNSEALHELAVASESQELVSTEHPTVGAGGGSFNTPNCLFKDDHN